MTNIAIILGRGVEGCGVTKNAVEFHKYHPDSKIFATDDKKWPRRESMKVDVEHWHCSDAEATSKITEYINNNFDAVIVYSVPSVKHPEKCIDNFVEMLEHIKKPMSLVQVDHNIMSITRNARLVDVCNSMDLLMTHSLDGAFANWCAKNNVKTPLSHMGVGFDYESQRKKYWRPIEEQDGFHLKWIGRCALWKGPIPLINFHNEYLRPRGFITSMEGLEASIQSLIILFEDGADRQKPRDTNQFVRGEEKDLIPEAYGKEIHGEAPYLYPEYKNDDCMQRLSLCGFGSDLYNLKPQLYGNNIEYCHAEVIGVGTVPFFHKHFGDHIIHKKTGKPASIGFSGTVWYNENDPIDTADTLKRLASDSVERDEWRETAFEFWRDHSDAESVYDDIIMQTLYSQSLDETKFLDDFFT